MPQPSDPYTRSPVHGFHLRDGLFFQRIGDDEVEIRVVLPPHHDRSAVLFSARTDIAGFASVVASVSARGETGATWREARRFLLEEPSDCDLGGDVKADGTVSDGALAKEDLVDYDEAKSREPEYGTYLWEIAYNEDGSRGDNVAFSYNVLATDLDAAVAAADHLKGKYCVENDLEEDEYEVMFAKRGPQVDLLASG